MKIVCVSFDEVGQACFRKIHQLGADIRAVITLEDTLRQRRSGQSPFEALADELGTTLLKCRNINDRHILDALDEIAPDFIFVIGWSQLVSPEFINKAKLGCFGMHPTMLPKHRGRAPQTWAIIMGLRITAVSMFYIEPEADNGDLVGQIQVPVYQVDTARALYDRVLRAHVRLIEQSYPLLATGKAPRFKQDGTRASHWEKRTPADGIIDWHCDATVLYDWIRALGKPYPGAFTFCRKGKLVVWASEFPMPLSCHKPGEVVSIDCRGALVQTGNGGLWLTHVQLAESEIEYEGHELALSKILETGETLG